MGREGRARRGRVLAASGHSTRHSWQHTPDRNGLVPKTDAEWNTKVTVVKMGAVAGGEGTATSNLLAIWHKKTVDQAVDLLSAKDVKVTTNK